MASKTDEGAVAKLNGIIKDLVDEHGTKAKARQAAIDQKTKDTQTCRSMPLQYEAADKNETARCALIAPAEAEAALKIAAKVSVQLNFGTTAATGDDEVTRGKSGIDTRRCKHMPMHMHVYAHAYAHVHTQVYDANSRILGYRQGLSKIDKPCLKMVHKLCLHVSAAACNFRS